MRFGDSRGHEKMENIKSVIDQNVVPALSHALISVRNYTGSILLAAQVWPSDFPLSLC